MAENKKIENEDNKKDMDNKNKLLIDTLLQKFPEKTEEEINAAIKIAGPDQKKVEDYLTNPVNGDGFTPTH